MSFCLIVCHTFGQTDAGISTQKKTLQNRKPSADESMLLLSQKRRRCHLLSLRLFDALLSSRPDPAVFSYQNNKPMLRSCHVQYFFMVKARSFEVLHGTSTCIIWGSEPFDTFCSYWLWFNGSKMEESRFPSRQDGSRSAEQKIWSHGILRKKHIPVIATYLWLDPVRALGHISSAQHLYRFTLPKIGGILWMLWITTAGFLGQ